MKKISKNLIYIFFILFIVSFLAISYVSSKLPDVYYVGKNENKNFSIYPFSVTQDDAVMQCLKSNISGNVNSEKEYLATVKFMNFLPIKNVKVCVSDEKFVVPCGIPFGVKLYTKGAVVIQTSEPPNLSFRNSKICKGDVIIAANNQEVKNNNDLEEIIQNSGGNEIEFKVMREGNEFLTKLIPFKSVDDDKYKIGIWVRDSSCGIGMLTFFEKSTNTFAGLGHGICDVDTSELLPLLKGEIVKASITNVVTGCKGSPGELKGCFSENELIGKICANNETGLYGQIENIDIEKNEIAVCMKQNVKKGFAQILTTIDGGNPQLYDINIDSINYDTTIPTKNMKISVTDSNILEKTGGIVQGMSGSPILQNGKLVGAITHVFVNNPSKGYAIFAETMLTNSNLFFESGYKNES